MITFTIDEAELILEYLEELKGCWSWKEGSIPKYNKQYKDLCDMITILRDKLSNNIEDDYENRTI